MREACRMLDIGYWIPDTGFVDGCGVQSTPCLAKKQYKEALIAINECLEHNRDLSQAWSLRSKVNLALGKDDKAIQDARRAISLADSAEHRKDPALALVQRDSWLGSGVSSSNLAETKEALQKAMLLNPDDTQLSNLHMKYEK